MFMRLLLILSSILFVADAAASRINFLQLGPDPLDNAKAVFEATVVSFVAPKGDEPGRVRLLVTSDWRRIYRGFSLLGRTIEVPYRGPQFPNALGGAKKSPQRFLFGIDATTDEVAFVAPRLATGRFHVTARAPVDHQSAQQSSSGSFVSFGYFVNGSFTGQYVESQLRSRYWDERSAFLDSVAKTTADTTAKLDTAAIDRLASQLDSADFAERNRAHQRLVAAGQENLEALRNAIARTKSLETRRRLARIERQIALHQALHRARTEIAARGSSVDAERKQLGKRVAPGTAKQPIGIGGGRIIRRR